MGSAGILATGESGLRGELPGIDVDMAVFFHGADGWRATFAEGPLCDVCGERCKRSAVGSLGPFAYAGDGYSDRCVALAADLRFARDGLAEWLDEQRVAYQPFDALHDVRAALRALQEDGAGDGRGG